MLFSMAKSFLIFFLYSNLFFFSLQLATVPQVLLRVRRVSVRRPATRCEALRPTRCQDNRLSNIQAVSNSLLPHKVREWSTSQELCRWFSISQTLYVWFVLCLVLLWLGTVRFYPYPSGLLHWHLGNHMIAPVPVKQSWRMWINY